MRIMIKGGVWKNTEDEILKAAVMKYGLNQWSRISSLLVRKSAKQCKARWYEWLDPSIKKTEWTRAEEEKLLHMAKLFPAQWRTIAPIIGRTPAQCLEHYEQLLEQATGRAPLPEDNDPRKLRPGEIDPAPETRPPRPDPVDMDDDEKEMLQEARARLSNTKGKKAKRKAREKQIEEARRLATLQRKRELRAAGIEIEIHKRIKPKMREMDYVVEIPFQHDVPQGPFIPDETEEPGTDLSAMRIAAQQLEASRRDEKESRNRQLDEKRIKKLKELDLPKAIEKIELLNQYQTPYVRTVLKLPPPQLTESDMVKFAKLGEFQGNTNQVTDALLGHFDRGTALIAPSQVITPSAENSLILDAQTIIALSRTETPLQGGENAPLQPGGFFSQPKSLVTPNPLLERLTPTNPIHISTPELPWVPDSFAVPDRLTQRKLERMRKEQEAAVLRKKLASLPAPENEYSFEVPELAEQPDELTGHSLDQEVLDSLTAKYSAESVAKTQQSQVVQRGLPLPSHTRSYTCTQTLVGREVQQLVAHDIEVSRGGRGSKELIEQSLLDRAKGLVDDEMPEVDLEAEGERFDSLVQATSAFGRLKLNAELTQQEEESLAGSFAYIRGAYEQSCQSAKVLELEAIEATKPLQKEAVKLEREIEKLQRSVDSTRIEVEVFEALACQDAASIESRLTYWSALVSAASEVQKELQRQYGESLTKVPQ
jgi:pre-mRNA-splicing factor CDC5/CEF1